jgi:RNA polymerase sigma-70 factor (ECF subfamily)
MDHHRKNKSAVPLDKVAEEIVSKTPADALETGEISAIVQKAVSQLPEKQKIAVLLHRYENLSHAQICEVTGWTKSAVESLLVRAYGNLRETLKN